MLAPAMNGKMWEHPATRANCELLVERGYHFIEPQNGMLACGYEGIGKMADVQVIVEAVSTFFESR